MGQMSPIGSWVEVAMKLFGNRGYDALLSRGDGTDQIFVGDGKDPLYGEGSDALFGGAGAENLDWCG